MSTTSSETRKKCGCGHTKDPQGFCDGSHAKQPPKDTRKKCGCGHTKDPQGYCDGSHAKKS
jgi:hypothetical protein